MTEVSRKGDATVSVRDDLAPRVVAVCVRCRGFKTVWITDCSCGDLWRLGFHIWAGHYERCPACRGRGLFYEND